MPALLYISRENFWFTDRKGYNEMEIIVERGR